MNLNYQASLTDTNSSCSETAFNTDVLKHQIEKLAISMESRGPIEEKKDLTAYFTTG